MEVIEHLRQLIPELLTSQNLGNITTSEIEEQNFFDIVLSDVIYKPIDVSMTNTSVKKLRLHQREYEWADYGGLINNDVPAIIYLLLKSINPETRIGIPNLKYEIEKETLEILVTTQNIFLMTCLPTIISSLIKKNIYHLNISLLSEPN